MAVIYNIKIYLGIFFFEFALKQRVFLFVHECIKLDELETTVQYLSMTGISVPPTATS